MDTAQPKERGTTSIWAAAHAYATGVPWLRTERLPYPSVRLRFIFDDTDGKASESFRDWWESDPLVPGRSLVRAKSILMDSAYEPATPQQQ